MRVLYLEPFEGGSHAAFSRVLTRGLDAEFTALTLPGRHWKWRMRGSAAWFAAREEMRRSYDLVFASSFVPLAELVGLVPDLGALPRVLYFHENQLTYPTRADNERDHHFGFTQLVSCLAASAVVFNSAYNLESFLDAGERLLARMPDAVPPDWIQTIRARARVLPVPLDLPEPPPRRRGSPPLILWNHRWEHDKDPDAFFAALARLEAPFRLAVCGEQFAEAPAIFAEAQKRFAHVIDHWGYLESRAAYERLLARADIVVSTARHEFFGVSVLEAVHFGARPLVPDRLAYVESIPDPFRYRDDAELVAELDRLCRNMGDTDPRGIAAPYLAANVLPKYAALLEELTRTGTDPAERRR